MSKKPIIGRCKICGQERILSYDHILPKIAGGGEKVKMYKAMDVINSEIEGRNNPFGKIYQDGYKLPTICKECNEYCGSWYDKDFAKFYRTLWKTASDFIDTEYGKPNERDPEQVSDILCNGSLNVWMQKIKPLNVAKRILASFCSIEYEPITDSMPELRRALTEKEYQIRQCDINLYMCFRLGGGLSYFGTQSIINFNNKEADVANYAGLEMGAIAFYMTKKANKMPSSVHLVDITHWLQKYCYNQEVDAYCVIPFNKTLGIPIPLERFR